MAFKKATACWFSILCFALISESLAEPETVDGLMKKNQNAWNVPIVAHQPNENKPTKVIGGYPGFKPDTLARPLKSQKGMNYEYYITKTSICNRNVVRLLM